MEALGVLAAAAFFRVLFPPNSLFKPTSMVDVGKRLGGVYVRW
jgi:hypothetical protein